MRVKNPNNKVNIYKVIAKVVSVYLAVIVSIVSVICMCETEAKADQSNYSLSDDEILAASLRSAGAADMIMTAEDFLADGERAADYEDIHEYIEELKDNGIEVQADTFISDDNGLFFSEDDVEDQGENQIEEQASSEEESNAAVIVIDDEEENEDAEEPKVDVNDWHLILVNKQNPVPEDYDAKLASINGSLMADERIVDDIYEMLDAAKSQGVDLMICSAYRSYDRQTTLFNNKMNKLMGKGMSYMEAYAVGSMSVTVPGTSEHQLGLALDILTSSYTGMDDGFADTKAGKWLAENAPKYGFILRYPKGKEDITGIIFEPWHFRYVGKEYSEEITELGVSLEEYLNGEY